ncbi:MAG: LptF/LptG family permease [Treponema sp.]|nr:LptF/LptG family permease [Treponema sp.]
MTVVFYMLRRFFPIFIGAALFFVLVLCLTDLFMNLWNYISKGVSFRDILLILLYYVPKALWYSVPIAMLFGTAYMLSDFYARNELLAIFASGISLVRFSLPLLAVAAAMSVALFFFEDAVVVPSYAQKVQLQDSVLYKEKSLNNSRIVIMAEGGNIIYKADFFESRTSRLYRLYVVFRNPDKSLDAVVYADQAVWEENSWKLDQAVEYKKDGGHFLVIEPAESELSQRLLEPPETFRNNTVSVEQVSTREAREYIAHLEKAGLPSAEEKSVYYKKYSFPFVVFIVVFLAIGLSGKTRKNVLVVSLALSVTAVVLFYVVQMITMLMAKFQTVSPLAGAWSPVVLFIVLSCILLKYAKT